MKLAFRRPELRWRAGTSPVLAEVALLKPSDQQSAYASHPACLMRVSSRCLFIPGSPRRLSVITLLLPWACVGCATIARRAAPARVASSSRAGRYGAGIACSTRGRNGTFISYRGFTAGRRDFNFMNARTRNIRQAVL